jgi:hypothetical protein
LNFVNQKWPWKPSHKKGRVVASEARHYGIVQADITATSSSHTSQQGGFANLPWACDQQYPEMGVYFGD